MDSEKLPLLQPILIKAPEESSSPPEQESETVTPKSENSVIKEPTCCPPAPRKPPQARRKPLGELSPNQFCAVPRELSAAFVKIPTSRGGEPPKKRIRLL